ncbi:MAG TPA: flagellar hook-basal body complex protein FliE [Candidatus Baltobacteraceae bacterium]|nr:flagellar hook-basal body complex protein FliE [Candidatus Baltobacteraceae bacterium]
MDINTGNKINPFVPDIGSAAGAPASSPIDGGSNAPSFKDTVKDLLSGVSDKVNQSDQLSRDLATGKTNDVSKVVTSVEEANLAMSFTLAVRNKLLDAYTEVSRMQL